MSYARHVVSLMLVTFAAGCTVLSGANDLRVDYTPAQSVSATDPDAGARPDATTTTPVDPGAGADAAGDDATTSPTDSGTHADAGAVCGDAGLGLDTAVGRRDWKIWGC